MRPNPMVTETNRRGDLLVGFPAEACMALNHGNDMATPLPRNSVLLPSCLPVTPGVFRALILDAEDVDVLAVMAGLLG